MQSTIDNFEYDCKRLKDVVWSPRDKIRYINHSRSKVNLSWTGNWKNLTIEIQKLNVFRSRNSKTANEIIYVRNKGNQIFGFRFINFVNLVNYWNLIRPAFELMTSDDLENLLTKQIIPIKIHRDDFLSKLILIKQDRTGIEVLCPVVKVIKTEDEQQQNLNTIKIKYLDVNQIKNKKKIKDFFLNLTSGYDRQTWPLENQILINLYFDEHQKIFKNMITFQPSKTVTVFFNDKIYQDYDISGEKPVPVLNDTDYQIRLQQLKVSAKIMSGKSIHANQKYANIK